MDEKKALIHRMSDVTKVRLLYCVWLLPTLAYIFSVLARAFPHTEVNMIHFDFIDGLIWGLLIMLAFAVSTHPRVRHYVRAETEFFDTYEYEQEGR